MKREDLKHFWLKDENGAAFITYDAADVDRLLGEKDVEIAALKAQIAEAKELSVLLQKRNKDIADNAIGNVEAYKSMRDAEIESLKASAYADSVDAGMRERRLRRALWLARVLRARDIQRWWIAATCAPITERACSIWKNVEIKCRAKEEKYR